MTRRLTRGLAVGRWLPLTGWLLVLMFAGPPLCGAGECALYPMALPVEVVREATPGEVLPDIFQGEQPGNFGWLSWGGNPSEPALIESLAAPGNSSSYVNPDDPADGIVSLGDWIQGRPGVANSARVRARLDALIGTEFVVPVWDAVRGQGERAAYRVGAFARVELISYALPRENRIRARFLGLVTCLANQPPVAIGQNLSILEDTPTNIVLNASDAEGSGLVYALVQGPTNGVLSGTAPEVVYRPATNYHGEDAFAFKANDGELDSEPVWVRIEIEPVNDAPVVSAGEDQTLFVNQTTLLQGTAWDDNWPPDAPLEIYWNVVEGLGVMSVSDPYSLRPEVGFSVPGTYRVRLSVSDSELTSTDELTVTVLPVNYPPAVSAGPDQLVLFPTSVALAGVVSDDGEPEGHALAVAWTKVNGPGVVSFTAAEAAATTASFSEPGVYLLRLTATDGELSATDDVVVTVNGAPAVDAGPDLVTTVSNSLSLAGSVHDDGLPGDALAMAWSKVSGPGLALFAAPTSTVTTVLFAEAGTYWLRLSATDSHGVGADDVLVSVRPPGENMPPRLSAGEDQRIALTNRTVLTGEVVDDGLPFEVEVTVAWSQVSGPGEVAFAEPSSAGTAVLFGEAGAYVLRLSASDGEFTVEDEITITVYPENQPPSVDAGTDQTIGSGRAVLSGRVSDDGLPGGIELEWSKAGGPGNVIFGDDQSAITTARFSEAGVYRLRLTASDSEFEGADEVVVSVTGNQAPLVDAGPDQVLDLALAAPSEGESTLLYPALADEWKAEVGWPGLTDVNRNFLGASIYPNGMTTSGSDLYVGGIFYYAGDVIAHNVARWDGCQWSALYDARPSDPSNPASPPIGFITQSVAVTPVAARSNEVFVAGGFLQDLDRNGHLDFTARWSGSGWERWQFHIASSSVAAGPMAAASNAVYFGGQFKFQTSNIPEAPVSFNIAKWNGQDWEALGEGIRDIRDSTDRNAIQYAGVGAMAVAPNGDVYVGGIFVMETATGLATNLARWTGRQWEAIPHNISGCQGFNCAPRITTLAAGPNGDLYVGGNFTHADGLAVNFVTRWDGADWHDLAGGTSGAINVLRFRGPDLYAAGPFGYAGGVLVYNAARWDGANWHALGEGVLWSVYAMAVNASGAYVGGGDLFSAGGKNVQNIAQWGRNELPEVSGPAPLTVQSSGATEVSLSLTLEVRHPCGRPLSITWSVDGDDAEQADFLDAGTTAQPRQITFTTQYSPGVHTLVATVADDQNDPVLFSTTVTVVAPALATLAGMVSDDGLPETATLSMLWELLEGPAVVTFSNPNSAFTHAAFDTAGTYLLRLTGNDSEWASHDQVTVNVRAAGHLNLPPLVHAGRDTQAALGDGLSWRAAVDDDGGTLTLRWSQTAGPGLAAFHPAEMTVATLPAALSGQVQFDLPGQYILRLEVSDSELASYDELVVLVEAKTNQPPWVEAGADQTVLLGNVALLFATVVDDGLPAGTLVSGWSQLSGPGEAGFYEVNGIAFVTFPEPGSYLLRLSASDGTLSSEDDVIVTVLADSPPPLASITAPADGEAITAPSVITGTVSSAILQSWQLRYRLKPPEDTSGDGWAVLAEGTTAVEGPLGVFDPTLLLNGIYEIELMATDQAGRSARAGDLTLVVEGNMKVGHFTLSFNDLTLPIAGIPIEIIRTYDSRNKNLGDFGRGWTLGLKNVRLQKNRPLHSAWQETRAGLGNYCLNSGQVRIVTLTFPGGRTEKFQAVSEPECQFGIPIVATTIRYLPLGHTRGSLKSLAADQDQVLIAGSIPGTVTLIDYSAAAYNPSRFEYTSAEGAVYIIDEKAGLQSMTDPNGHTLTLTAQGVFYSTAQSPPVAAVTIERDALGRITLIVDSAGNAIHYRYDAAGHLAEFVDRAGQTNTFAYNTRQELVALTDGRGLDILGNQFDAAGRLVAQVDAHGQTNSFNHDLSHRLELLTDRLGHLTVHEYDERGNVVRTVAPDGGVSFMTYDDADNLLTHVDPLGRTNRFLYDPQDNRIALIDPLGNTTRLTYNSNRRPTSITDPNGNIVSNRYDQAHNLVWIQDPLGQVTTFGYERGLLVATTNAFGRGTRLEYDPLGRLTNRIDALGHATAFQRDSNGNVTAEITTRTTAAGLETLVTRFAYDAQDRLTNLVFADGSAVSASFNAIDQVASFFDPLGRRTSFEYDAQGRPLRTTYPDLTTDSLAYDPEGRPSAYTNRLGQVTRFDYDPVGRLVRVEYPDGAGITNHFDQAGQWIASTDARGFSTFYSYDPAGRNSAITNPLSQVTRFNYDPNGNLLALIDALGRTNQFEYDPLNRRVRTLFADGTVSGVLFDPLGRLVASTDQNGNTTRFGHDPLGRLTTVTNALGQVTRYAYNELGQQTERIDANGHITTYQYDPLGRRLRRTLPGLQSESYAYDPAGNLTSRTDFNGYSTSFHYDQMDRLIARLPDPRRGEPALTFAYNALGWRTNMIDASGTTRYAYDVRNRLAQKIKTWAGIGLSVALTYGYDASGNLTTLDSSSPNGAQVAYSYDPLDRLEQVNDPHLGTTSYTYDHAGNLRALSSPNGVQTSYHYDSLDRLTNQTAARLDTPLAGYVYTLDAAGNRLSAEEALHSFAPDSAFARQYRYDAAYRLADETITQPGLSSHRLDYAYDPAGNRLSLQSTLSQIPSTAYSYDANDRLLSDSYDANGNTLFAAGFTQTQPDRYDFEDRLLERRSTLDSQLSTLSFQYDGDGNRVSKTVNGFTTYYLVDELNPTGYSQVLEELVPAENGLLTPVRHYTYGYDLLAQDQLIDAGTGLTWKASFYGYDGQGSVRFLTDLAGHITDSYDYDAFGNLIAQAGLTPNLHLHRGEQFDPDLGLYYLRARYHNPASGRFWTMDSFEGFGTDPASLHHYTYNQNDPVNRFDPSGHLSLPEVNAVGALRLDLSAGVINHGIVTGLRAMGIAPLFQIRSAMVEAAIDGNDALLATLQDHYAFALFANATFSEQLDTLEPILDLAHAGAAAVPLLRSAADFPAHLRQFQKTWGNWSTRSPTTSRSRITPRFGLNRLSNAKTVRAAPTGQGITARTGLTTGADEAVFWSGIGRGGDVKAANWVAQQGGSTLETTLASRGIKLPVWDASNPASVAAWRQASTEFAAGARGNVRVLQGDALRVDAIWRDEFKALQVNPNVNSIRAINPDTGAEVLLWSR